MWLRYLLLVVLCCREQRLVVAECYIEQGVEVQVVVQFALALVLALILILLLIREVLL